MGKYQVLPAHGDGRSERTCIWELVVTGGTLDHLNHLQENI